MKKGFIQIYTGDGKGKTTAAVGLAVRASFYNL
ncbi:MAG: cob(I)yrinic acid a,c-diamide adenosyltransferase, partial [candidate division WOR-3 bacterium]